MISNKEEDCLLFIYTKNVDVTNKESKQVLLSEK
jgi:hypothetical protein